jgi:hypothetical protein
MIFSKKEVDWRLNPVAAQQVLIYMYEPIFF